MAKTNNRPPFLFKLQKEMDIDNDKFFYVKKKDLEGRNNTMRASMKLKIPSLASKDKISDTRATAVKVSTRM
jgi:hypothetical protein